MNKNVTYQPQRFNLSGLHGISDQTLEAHFKLYEGYIGIGGSLTTSLLPHHRAYGSVPRRFG
jgi:hypothetical protein